MFDMYRLASIVFCLALLVGADDAPIYCRVPQEPDPIMAEEARRVGLLCDPAGDKCASLHCVLRGLRLLDQSEELIPDALANFLIPQDGFDETRRLLSDLAFRCVSNAREWPVECTRAMDAVGCVKRYFDELC